MRLRYRFFTVSYVETLQGGATVTEFLYLGDGPPLQLVSTQDPNRYGGPIFISAEQLPKVLRLLRADVRYATKTITVEQVNGVATMVPEQLDMIVRDSLMRTLDFEERRILGLNAEKT